MKIIKESPDEFTKKDGTYLEYNEYDAYAFGYYKDKLYIALDSGQTHYDLRYDYEELEDVPGHVRDKLDYPGRLWYSEKVISFWRYPETGQKLKKIVDEISSKFNDLLGKEIGEDIDIWNDFSMDIIQHKKSEEIDYEYISDGGDIKDGYKIEVIPVKEFKSSLGRSDKELKMPHLLSPIEKNKLRNKKRVKGFGADKRFPLDMPQTVHHQMQYTGDGVIKLKNLVENTIGILSKRINVRIDINKTKHAGERQFRDGDIISDDDIRQIVQIALPDIANMLIFDEIDMHDYVLIRHVDSLINIIGNLKPGRDETIDFVVITVMKKKDFMPKKGTAVINI